MNYPIFNYYKESVAIMNKGLEGRMERTVTVSPCPDLSENKFHGEIPEEIRDLKLSHNNFLGQIPSSMMNLTGVESLDLSKNQLSAEIPPQLTKRRVGSHFDEMPCEDKLCFVEIVFAIKLHWWWPRLVSTCTECPF
ncbi:hypothetical protein NC652_027254 [Populus alba x Populus x berolinensis]|nr:hypothetical protein NC652_027254 [Populus alba x Populus x berolinensis]